MTAYDGVFVGVALALLVVSRHSLRTPRAHGFYRLFAFLSLAALLWLNLPLWPGPRSAWLEALSSLLQYGSLYLFLHSLYLLTVRGGHGRWRTERANFAFENTARLVDRGPYGYVRHPMYGSLLLLLWGVCLKGPHLLPVALALLGSVALMLAARVEEGENLATFGETYRAYMGRTRMFVPFVF